MLKRYSVSGMRGLAVLLALTMLIGIPSRFARPIRAAGNTIIVTDTTDAASCTTTISLRCAITSANAYGLGPTTITFSVTGTITVGSSLVISNQTQPITIDGTDQSIVISGSGNTQIFFLNNSTQVTLTALSITNGFINGIGGGIYNAGTLIINSSTLSSNAATGTTGDGGGVYNGGTLTISNSTLSSNSATFNGGGVYNSGGTVTISNSTLSSDTATNSGGGVYSYGNSANLTINSSTLSGDTATNSGGGVYNDLGTLVISNSTVSGNSAPNGAGVYSNFFGTVTIGNSTLSGNTASNVGGGLTATMPKLLSTIVAHNMQGNGGDVSGTAQSLGYNLIGDGTGSTGYVSSDQVGTSVTPINPMLGPLSLNGGTTMTMAVLSGSPAIGYGNCGGSTIPPVPPVSTDQRGTARVNTGAGLGCDIGAYESHLTPNTPTATSTASNTSTSTATITGTNTATATSSPTHTATVTATTTSTPTNTATNTFTNTPTNTPSKTATFTATSTPSKTSTQTNTATLTATNTATKTATLTNTPTNTATSTPVPTRIDSIGIYRTGTFYLRLHNTTGFADLIIAFTAGTRAYPIVGDWTGAGFDTVGVYDQSNGQFTLCTANDTTSCANVANHISLVLGIPNDAPLSGRWMLNAANAGVGVLRPSNGLIYLKNGLTTGFADYTMVLGVPGDRGLAGDWNGKGFDSPGVYRPGNSTFYLSNLVTNGSVIGDYQFQYGIGGDAPVNGDWIAQGHDGVGLFRQSNGFTYLKNQLVTGYADNSFTYGVAGDIPIAGHWQVVYPPRPPAPVLIPKTAAPPQPNGNIGNNGPIGD